jgi:hypothetical protein
LQHPGVVQIHEFGTHDGLPFCALEYCPGGTLAERLRGTPLPARDAARTVEQLARAVQAAHQKGIVHRDLKPGNVVLDASGQPKVSDFGLARWLEGGAGLTQTGAVIGTPSYMAPEQARGHKDIGPAADVYGLGAVLYECLTGRPPFRAATPYDTILQVVSDEPVAPRLLNAKVPRDLETVCLKCLEKDPRQRYASCQELADDLRRWLEGEPVKARPPGPVERLAKWARRNPAVAALVAALLLGAGTATFFAERRRAGRKGEGLRPEHGDGLPVPGELRRLGPVLPGAAHGAGPPLEGAARLGHHQACRTVLPDRRLRRGGRRPLVRGGHGEGRAGADRRGRSRQPAGTPEGAGGTVGMTGRPRGPEANQRGAAVDTKGLAKLYDHLTPHERLPLIVAASTRGDEVESGRLVNSAPRDLYKVPDYYGLADALRGLVLMHVIGLLDLAALYWRVSGHLEAYSGLFGEKGPEQPARLEATLRLVAWRYCFEVDGWSRFCEGLKIEADAFLKDLPGHETLREVEEEARLTAFTTEEAETHLRARSHGDLRLPTADELGRRWRRDLDHVASLWGREPTTDQVRAGNERVPGGGGGA